MHRAEEDYLKTIYKLTVEDEKELVKTTVIADIIGSTDQTVNEMIRRLAKKRMVNFIRYKGVSLTKWGVTEAMRLIRNHRLWEVFLVEKLGYAWTEVHDEAELLEHAASDMLMDKIDKFLNRPEYCVHGNAIPKKNGVVPETCKDSLNTLSVGETMVIKRVIDQPVYLKYFSDQKILIGSKATILEKDAFNEIMRVSVDQQELVLANTIADKIFGERVSQ